MITQWTRSGAIVIALACALLAVDLASAAPPANNNLSSATVISTLSFAGTGNTAEATLEAGEPSPTCEAGATSIGNTVWYRHSAAVSGSLIADTTGSNFDTVLAVYSGPSSGASFATLSALGCNDDGGGAGTSAISFSVTSGTTYYFQVGGSFAEFGALMFHLATVSGNDNLSAARSALPIPYSDSVTTTGATNQTGEPSPSCEFGPTSIGKTVWYKFTPSDAMSLEASTNGSSYDTVLAVYSGPAASPTTGALSFVECDDQSGWLDNSALVFVATGGTTYYFQAGGYLGDSGSLIFNLSQVPDEDLDGVPDASDNCPKWPNPGQNLPPWPVPAEDPDCDGWSDAREQHVVTDAAKHCNVTAALNDESDNWPGDFNDDRITNLPDIISFGPTFNKQQGQPGYNSRYDLNISDSVLISDIIILGPFFNKTCSG